MKGLAVSLMLGMMLVFVLLFGYWLRTLHPLSTRWSPAIDRGLEPGDVIRN